ncbi:hypothetical protein V6N11_039037 [Hibiscus sabdariffa]|uniref:Uncharacterized protein n=1 Tax=Hibiscus sabdariffa TaxID=183260 RepID=A0ABR2SLR4_9ROSI
MAPFLNSFDAKCGDLLRAKRVFGDIQMTGMLSRGTTSSMGTLKKARQDHRLSWNSFSAENVLPNSHTFARFLAASNFAGCFQWAASSDACD